MDAHPVTSSPDVEDVVEKALQPVAITGMPTLTAASKERRAPPFTAASVVTVTAGVDECLMSRPLQHVRSATLCGEISFWPIEFRCDLRASARHSVQHWGRRGIGSGRSG